MAANRSRPRAGASAGVARASTRAGGSRGDDLRAGYVQMITGDGLTAFKAGGGYFKDFGVGTVGGGVDGTFVAEPDVLFELIGRARACGFLVLSAEKLFGGDGCAEVQGIVSSNGIGACGSLLIDIT